MNKKNLVSIIMNCHNGDEYLKEAVNSIIKQSYKNWELIFFDNNSNDDSSKIIKSYKDKRIKYFYSKFVNLGLARKKALNLCSGRFVAFLDCDDYWKKNKLKLQVNDLLKNPSFGVSFSNSIFFNNKDRNLLYKKKPLDGYIFEALLKKYYLSFDTILIDILFIKKLNEKFDKKFTIIHDLDLLIRLSQICKFKYINIPLSYWRIHNNSFSQNKMSIVNNEKKKFLIKLNKILKKNYDKERLISFFRENLNQSLMEQYIIEKKYKNFMKIILRSKRNILKNLLLFFFMVFPFGGHIYKKFKKSW